MTSPEPGNLPQPESSRRELPKKEFYLKNPRATQLRDVSLRITGNVGKLINDSSVAQDRQRQEELYKDLEAYNGELIQLGIQPNMHVDDTFEFNKSTVKTDE